MSTSTAEGLEEKVAAEGVGEAPPEVLEETTEDETPKTKDEAGEVSQRRYPFTGGAFKSMADPDPFGRTSREHHLISQTFENLAELRGVPMDEVGLAEFFGRDGQPETCEVCEEQFQPYWGAITLVDFDRKLTDSLHNQSDALTSEQVESLYLHHDDQSVFGCTRKMTGNRVIVVSSGEVICDAWGCGTPWFNRRQPLELDNGRLIYASPNVQSCLGALRANASRITAQLKTLKQLEWMIRHFSGTPEVAKIRSLHDQVTALAQDTTDDANLDKWKDAVRFTVKDLLANNKPGQESEENQFFREKVEGLLDLVKSRTQPCCTRADGDLLIAQLAPKSPAAHVITKERRQRKAAAAGNRMRQAAFGGRSHDSTPDFGVKLNIPNPTR